MISDEQTIHLIFPLNFLHENLDQNTPSLFKSFQILEGLLSIVIANVIGCEI